MTRWTNVVWALLTVLSLTVAPAYAQGGGASSTGSIRSAACRTRRAECCPA